MVLEDTSTVKIFLDKADKTYAKGDLMTINGRDIDLTTAYSITIEDSQENHVVDLILTVNSEGHFYHLWKVPSNLTPGDYNIVVNNGENTNSIIFTLR